jgi:hypothetical protein
VLAGVLLVTLRGSGQLLQLSAGASTLFGAQGGSATLRTEHSTTVLEGGLVNHHAVAGGSTTLSAGPYRVTLGEQELHLDLSTDLFQEGHVFFGTGLGVQHPSPRNDLSFFLGETDQAESTPLFGFATPQQKAVFLRVSRTRRLCSVTSMFAYKQFALALQNLACNLHGLQLSGSIGLSHATPYAAGALRYQGPRLRLKAAYIATGTGFARPSSTLYPASEPTHQNVEATWSFSRHLQATAAQENFLVPATTGAAASTSHMAELGLQWLRRTTALSATILRSSINARASTPSVSNLTTTATLTQTTGRVQWTGMLLRSQSTSSTASTLILTQASLAINPHLRIVEGVGYTPGQTNITLSHGGVLQMRFSEIEVDHQLLYLANDPAQPLRQATLFHARIHLWRSYALEAASTLNPLGQILYTFGVSGAISRTAPTDQPPGRIALGTHIVRAHVSDETGKPVDGAALLIGERRLYTDSHGEIAFHDNRSRTYTLAILTAEFLDGPCFRVVNAPAQLSTARVDTVATIVVRRLPPEACAGLTQVSRP